MWDFAEIGRALAAGLSEAEARLALEQSPLGIDALDELALHPLIAGAIRNTSHGVLREQRYPANSHEARRSEGERCDFVLTPEPGQHLRDPLLAGTLFADEGIDSEEALWMEMKIVAQHAFIDGACRPNPSYTSEFLGGLHADIRKLSSDSGIAHGALLVLLFTEDVQIAEHDLKEWTQIALKKSLPISVPLTFQFPVRDLIGNSSCTVCLIQVHRS